MRVSLDFEFIDWPDEMGERSGMTSGMPSDIPSGIPSGMVLFVNAGDDELAEMVGMEGLWDEEDYRYVEEWLASHGAIDWERYGEPYSIWSQWMIAFGGEK